MQSLEETVTTKCDECCRLKEELQMKKSEEKKFFFMLKEKITSNDILFKQYGNKCKELENVKAKNSILERDCSNYGKDLASALQELEPLKKTSKVVEQKNKKLEKECQSLQERLSSDEVLIKQHQILIKNLKTEVSTKTEDLQKKNKEVHKLKEDNEKLKRKLSPSSCSAGTTKEESSPKKCSPKSSKSRSQKQVPKKKAAKPRERKTAQDKGSSTDAEDDEQCDGQALENLLMMSGDIETVHETNNLFSAINTDRGNQTENTGKGKTLVLKGNEERNKSKASLLLLPVSNVESMKSDAKNQKTLSLPQISCQVSPSEEQDVINEPSIQDAKNESANRVNGSSVSSVELSAVPSESDSKMVKSLVAETPMAVDEEAVGVALLANTVNFCEEINNATRVNQVGEVGEIGVQEEDLMDLRVSAISDDADCASHENVAIGTVLSAEPIQVTRLVRTDAISCVKGADGDCSNGDDAIKRVSREEQTIVGVMACSEAVVIRTDESLGEEKNEDVGRSSANLVSPMDQVAVASAGGEDASMEMHERELEQEKNEERSSKCEPCHSEPTSTMQKTISVEDVSTHEKDVMPLPDNWHSLVAQAIEDESVISKDLPSLLQSQTIDEVRTTSPGSNLVDKSADRIPGSGDSRILENVVVTGKENTEAIPVESASKTRSLDECRSDNPSIGSHVVSEQSKEKHSNSRSDETTSENRWLNVSKLPSQKVVTKVTPFDDSKIGETPLKDQVLSFKKITLLENESCENRTDNSLSGNNIASEEAKDKSDETPSKVQELSSKEAAFLENASSENRTENSLIGNNIASEQTKDKSDETPSKDQELSSKEATLLENVNSENRTDNLLSESNASSEQTKDKPLVSNSGEIPLKELSSKELISSEIESQTRSQQGIATSEASHSKGQVQNVISSENVMSEEADHGGHSDKHLGGIPTQGQRSNVADLSSQEVTSSQNASHEKQTSLGGIAPKAVTTEVIHSQDKQLTSQEDRSRQQNAGGVIPKPSTSDATSLFGKTKSYSSVARAALKKANLKKKHEHEAKRIDFIMKKMIAPMGLEPPLSSLSDDSDCAEGDHDTGLESQPSRNAGSETLIEKLFGSDDSEEEEVNRQWCPLPAGAERRTSQTAAGYRKKIFQHQGSEGFEMTSEENEYKEDNDDPARESLHSKTHPTGPVSENTSRNINETSARKFQTPSSSRRLSADFTRTPDSGKFKISVCFPDTLERLHFEVDPEKGLFDMEYNPDPAPNQETTTSPSPGGVQSKHFASPAYRSQSENKTVCRARGNSSRDFEPALSQPAKKNPFCPPLAPAIRRGTSLGTGRRIQEIVPSVRNPEIKAKTITKQKEVAKSSSEEGVSSTEVSNTTPSRIAWNARPSSQAEDDIAPMSENNFDSFSSARPTLKRSARGYLSQDVGDDATLLNTSQNRSVMEQRKRKALVLQQADSSKKIKISAAPQEKTVKEVSEYKTTRLNSFGSIPSTLTQCATSLENDEPDVAITPVPESTPTPMNANVNKKKREQRKQKITLPQLAVPSTSTEGTKSRENDKANHAPTPESVPIPINTNRRKREDRQKNAVPQKADETFKKAKISLIEGEPDSLEAVKEFWKSGNRAMETSRQIENCLSTMQTLSGALDAPRVARDISCTLLNRNVASSEMPIVNTFLMYLVKSRKNVFIDAISEGLQSPVLSPFENTFVSFLFHLNGKKPHLENLLPIFKKQLVSFLFCGRHHTLFGASCLVRVYSAVCRKQGDLAGVRVLCYDLLINQPDKALFLVTSAGGVWPEVLLLADNKDQGNEKQGSILQRVFCYLLMSTEFENKTLEEQSKTVLQKLCSYQMDPSLDLPGMIESVVDTLQRSGGNESQSYECCRALELLCGHEAGRKSTRGNLVDRHLLPLLPLWLKDAGKTSSARVLIGLLGSFCKSHLPPSQLSSVTESLVAVLRERIVGMDVQEAAVYALMSSPDFARVLPAIAEWAALCYREGSPLLKRVLVERKCLLT